MDGGKVSQSPVVEEEEGSSANKEEELIWCLRRVGKSSDWLRLAEGTEVTLGRALNVTYQLLSLSCPLMISRQHCLFKQNKDGQWTVTDRKSLNGVWVNGERIVAEKAWPLSKGDVVRLGVPVEGVPMEFEYALVQDRLEAVRPSLRGQRADVEEATAPPRAKKTKRSLEPDPTGSPESRAKLYRCAAVDKSLGRPCPAGEPPLLVPQLPQAPGPSLVTPQPEGHRPASHGDLGAGPQAVEKTLRDTREQLRSQQSGRSEEIREQQLRSQQPGRSEEIREQQLRSQLPGRSEEIREQLQLRSQQPGRSEEIRELQSQLRSQQPGRSEEIRELQSQLRSQQPGRSEEIRELQSQLRSQQPGRSEEIRELLQQQLRSQQPGRSEEIRELLQQQLRSQQPGRSEEIRELQSQLRSQQPGRSEEIREQQQQLRSQQPGRSEEIRELLQQQLRSQQPGRSEEIRELLQQQLRSQQPGRSEEIRELQSQLRSQQPGRSEEIREQQQRSQQPGRSEELRELQAQQCVLQARLRSQEEQQLEDLLHQEEMRMEVEKRQQQEEHLKKQLEDALQEQRKVIEELKCSRQGFEEILQAKDKELEMTKEEKDQARAQKDEVLIQMTDVLENELQCIVCSELFIEAVTLSCAHSFCRHCIGAWQKRSRACPICRQDILSQARSLVLDNCIDRMVESLSAELKEHRQTLIAERKEQSAAVELISEEDPSNSSDSYSSGSELDVDGSELLSESGSIASLDETSLSSRSESSSSFFSVDYEV